MQNRQELEIQLKEKHDRDRFERLNQKNFVKTHFGPEDPLPSLYQKKKDG